MNLQELKKAVGKYVALVASYEGHDMLNMIPVDVVGLPDGVDLTDDEKDLLRKCYEEATES